MQIYRAVERLLEERHPGTFRCTPVIVGKNLILRVEARTRSRMARVKAHPSTEHAYVEMPIDDELPGLDQARYTRAEDIVQELLSWAFPPAWRRPAPVDRERVSKSLARRWTGVRARNELLVVLSQSALDAAGLGDVDIDPNRIRRCFPADAAGRPALRTRVVLAMADDEEAALQRRTRCLVAIGPARRQDPPRIRLAIEEVIVRNQNHIWWDHPWLWTPAAVPTSGLEPPTDLDRQALRDLDDGDFESAFGAYGFALDSDLDRLLGGQRIVTETCARPDARWCQKLVDTLRLAAPWKLERALTSEWDRRNRARRRPLKSLDLHLATFPGQRHQRMSRLAVWRTPGHPPRIGLETTASNLRLHHEAWQRPLWMDLRWYGVDAAATPA